MKIIRLACALAVAASMAQSAAQADDIVAMISQYRRAHGLPAVKSDAKLAAVAERQARAMAAAGIMDHDVAGSFASRIAGAAADSAGENIAEGTKTWADTLRLWQNSPGHNANLLLRDADVIGVAVAHNDATRYKTYWAMVIGHRAIPNGGPMVREASSAPPRHEPGKASTAGAGATGATGAASAAGAAAAWVTNTLSAGRKWLFGQ
jgi:hypothetical protein